MKEDLQKGFCNFNSLCPNENDTLWISYENLNHFRFIGSWTKSPVCIGDFKDEVLKFQARNIAK